MQSLTAMSKRGLQLSQRMTAALALALFCWLNVLAVSPVLHAQAHCDGEHAGADHSKPVQSPEHRCAVTLLAQGQLELIVPTTVPTAPTSFVLLSQPVVAPAFPADDLRLSPGRAPPVLPA
jgi:hypothetical protein